ncbi:MAG: cell division protein SepF [Acidaminococcaceae bacterium]|nr:cell division protein SepF [Acidaminococcaceae bacterium]MDD4721492.1 cell division protein SepF [Acidaminococcaceae bacterium]
MVNLKSAVRFFNDADETEVRGPVLVETPAMNMRVRTPRNFQDVQAYADALMSGDTLLISYVDLDDAASTRVADYLAGVCYIAGASVELITPELLLYTPNTVSVERPGRRNY